MKETQQGNYHGVIKSNCEFKELGWWPVVWFRNRISPTVTTRHSHPIQPLTPVIKSIISVNCSPPLRIITLTLALWRLSFVTRDKSLNTSVTDSMIGSYKLNVQVKVWGQLIL